MCAVVNLTCWVFGCCFMHAYAVSCFMLKFFFFASQICITCVLVGQLLFQVAPFDANLILCSFFFSFSFFFFMDFKTRAEKIYSYISLKKKKTKIKKMFYLSMLMQRKTRCTGANINTFHITIQFTIPLAKFCALFNDFWI